MRERSRSLSPSVAGLGLASLAFLVRCSLLTSLDGLTGGATDAGATAVSSLSDAQAGDVAPPPVLGASDATVDDAAPISAPPRPEGGAGGEAGGADAAPPRDGGRPNDAGAAEGGSTLLFADDFEGSASLPRGWDMMATTDGTLDLDPTLYTSPTTSLRATALALPAGAPGNAANVTLRKVFPLPKAGVTVAYDFDVYPKQYDPTADVVLGALQVNDGAGNLYELQLDVRLDAAGALDVIFAEYTGLADGGSLYVAHPITTSIPVTAWTHVRLALTASQPPVAQVSFDGTLALLTEVAIPIAGVTLQLSLGLSYVSAPSGTWVIHYDNAAYRSSP